MRTLAVLAVVACSASVSAESYVVDLTGLRPGDDVTVLTDATVHVAPAKNLLKVAVGPPTEPDPLPTGLRGKVKTWAAARNDAVNARKLVAVYTIVAQQIDGGTITDRAIAIEVTKQAAAQVVGASWSPFFDALSAELNTMQAAGQLNTVGDVSAAWKQISAGLDDAANASSAASLTPEQWQEIIRLIIQIILSLLAG